MFFFFNATATTEIYTLSLHDALPISHETPARLRRGGAGISRSGKLPRRETRHLDRKSTRLNSSHMSISYAVFCLKKKRLIQTLTKVSGTAETSTIGLVSRTYSKLPTG